MESGPLQLFFAPRYRGPLESGRLRTKGAGWGESTEGESAAVESPEVGR